MSTKCLQNWIYLATCPSDSEHVVVPTGINKDNFIALQLDDNLESFNFIHKYNFETNKWTTTKCNPIPYRSDSITLDAEQNVLYNLNDNNNLMEIELNNNKITKHLLSSENNHNSTSKCVIVNNELFVIGGEDSDSISKWNADTKQLTKISTIYNTTMLDEFGLIYENQTNSILIFGGFDNGNTNFKSVDYILEYDLITNTCNKLPVSLPNPMSCDCCLKVINNSYVLVFDEYNDDIYIYSIKKQTITKSKIKCPTKCCLGTIVNDKVKDEKCVFGFVRNTWKICKIENHYFPPFYLLKLMHKYYLNEWVYLLDENTGKNYKMSTLDIVSFV